MGMSNTKKYEWINGFKYYENAARLDPSEQIEWVYNLTAFSLIEYKALKETLEVYYS